MPTEKQIKRLIYLGYSHKRANKMTCIEAIEIFKLSKRRRWKNWDETKFNRGQKPTEKQIKYLRHYGINLKNLYEYELEDRYTKAEAQRLINFIRKTKTRPTRELAVPTTGLVSCQRS